MSQHDQLVGRFRREVAYRLALRQAVAAATVWAFAWGTAVLILRLTHGASLPGLLVIGAVGLPVAVGLAAWVALRRVPDDSAVRAVLDSRCGCGGLLMAGAERDLGGWDPGPAAAELPRLRWQGRRAVGRLAVALAYVALAFLLPARSLAGPGSALDIDRPADRLAEQVRVLQEEKILEPERAEDLKARIDDLRSRAAAKEPAKTLEALDQLNEAVRQTAQQAAEARARQAQQLEQVAAAADALQKAAPALDPKDLADLTKELAEAARKAAGETEALQKNLGEELAKDLAEGKLSPEQLSQLSDAAKKAKDALAKGAQNLHRSNLIDRDQLKACEGGKCDADGLAKYLEGKLGKKSLKEGLRKQEGKGGTDDDGPGVTPLNFGDRSPEDGGKFREETLPPADLAALKESRLAGVSPATPEPDPKAPAPKAGGLTGAAAGGGSAAAAPVLPQHRGAVGRYFDRPGK